MTDEHTIIALATPSGKSGVAVFRASGAQALPLALALSGKSALTPRMATYATLRHANERIDSGLLLYFPAPASFTGEEVVEFHLHGSRAVAEAFFAAALTFPNVRMAEAGEFSRRAYADGKMDLLEAEGLLDLIEAETALQLKQSHSSARASKRLEQMRAQLIRARALIEAHLDFPDEEIPAEVLAQATALCASLAAELSAALAEADRAAQLREGFSVVITGEPNVGKSSLLNALSGRDAAIVSAHAGTTRDAIETHLDVGGYPVVLVDTAGLRVAADEIEAEGIARARARAESAHLRVSVVDASTPRPQALPALDPCTILVLNKADCAEHESWAGVSGLRVSAKTGAGLENLFAEIGRFLAEMAPSSPCPLASRARHKALLSNALMHLQRAQTTRAPELIAEELRLSAEPIGKITGKIVLDELLDVVFREFCIGK